MKATLFMGAAAMAFATPALAQSPKRDSDTASEAATAAPAKKAFTTGVAKGRNMLDTAISASAMDETQAGMLGARSLSEVLRNIPGIRAEVDSGEGGGNYTIRGLPLASSGSKFMQFEEDGLPILEFGDTMPGADTFLRTDLSLSQIQTIRGGSASTFASNSPGGVINLISRTGETDGGDIMLTTGLDFGWKRFDFNYGGHVADGLRFNIGGFYRQGEGTRAVGYDAYKGGQIKLNVTKDFAGGYIRFYAKMLDDRTPSYADGPVGIGGTADNPEFHGLGNFELGDLMLSRNVVSALALDENNAVYNVNVQSDSRHAKYNSIGFETQFEVSDWTITDRFRFASISADVASFYPVMITQASSLVTAFAGPNGSLVYASGPKAGQTITDPGAINGNGLIAMSQLSTAKYDDLGNVTNDLRASRVWHLGDSVLTGTVGYYHASQAISYDQFVGWIYTDVAGGGNSALLDLVSGSGDSFTDAGSLAFGGYLNSGQDRRRYDLHYSVDAPYASANWKLGKLALGASLRYDIGRARGAIYGWELNRTGTGLSSLDMNHDGTINEAETRVALLPSTSSPVHYGYHYLSYSVSANYRVSEDMSVFGRYSRGARAGADRLLFSPSVSSVDGSLAVPDSAFDPVKQAEIGTKYRSGNLELNLTGFWANTREQNVQTNTTSQGILQQQMIVRGYRAIGAEFEGSYAFGRFSLAGGATYTKAEITQDLANPELVGNTPRHQPKLIYFVTPQIAFPLATFGLNIVGQTSSYAQDSNYLKLPGYTLVNAFVQFRPMRRVTVMVDASNLFDKRAVTAITTESRISTGYVAGRTVNPRSISASLRFSF